MVILQFIFIFILACCLGGLSIFLMFFPGKFKAWASDHLDRNKTTGEAMFDLTPRPRIWDISEAPNWYYRIIGVVTTLVSFVLYLSLILNAFNSLK